MSFDKTRSLRAIMHSIASFCLSTEFEGGHVSPGFNKFFGGAFLSSDVRAGDLVALQAAPVSDWSFSWVIDVDKSDEERIGPRYLLESIFTGEQVWWSNVGVSYYDREKIDESWRWTDRQWVFCDRWLRTCAKNYNSSPSILVAAYPKFNDDGSAIMRARKKWTSDIFEIPIENWKKLTLANMSGVIKDMDDMV